HFYLASPLVAGLLIALVPRQSLLLLWILLVVASPALRWMEWVPEPEFGYTVTATHLRLDGLIIGFGLSHIAVYAPRSYRQMVGLSLPAAAGSLAGLAWLEWFGG